MSASDGLAGAAATGDTRATLVALRDFLAAQLEATDSKRDVAALAARFVDVLTRLDVLPAPSKGTVLDELAARRAGDGERVTARPARARRG